MVQELTQKEWLDFIRSIGLDSDEGWIDKRGRFWACPHDLYKHSDLAANILGVNEPDAESEADKRGWLRISDYGTRTASKRLNQRQMNTLFDWCQFHHVDFDEFLKGIQYL